jgi:hypothetical protein
MPDLSAAHLQEVSAWLRRWSADPVIVETVKPAPRITIQRERGPLVFDADSVARLVL